MAFTPNPDVQTVSLAELAKQAEGKFAKTREGFFYYKPSAEKLTDLIQIGAAAIKAEKDASPLRGMQDKGGSTLDYWEDKYQRALAGDHKALKVVVNSVAGMAVEDAESRVKEAKRDSGPLNKFLNESSMRLSQPVWALEEEGSLPARLSRGVVRVFTWRNPNVHEAELSLDTIRRNADQVITKVETQEFKIKL